MANSDTSFDQIITHTIVINSDPVDVWRALTEPQLMNQWMFESELEIITDWKIGSPIIIKGSLEFSDFENKGILLKYEPKRILQYSHLSSLSALPDQLKSYTIIEFRLTPENGQTNLTLTLSNFPTRAIYHHFAFYWIITLDILRKFCESLG